MEDIVIVAAARTAVGKFGGTLAATPATELGAIVIKSLLERSGVDPQAVGEVILGQVLAAGCGQNPARQAMLKAGLPKETPALTIAPSSVAGVAASVPPNLPTAVRAAATMTMSSTVVLLWTVIRRPPSRSARERAR